MYIPTNYLVCLYIYRSSHRSSWSSKIQLVFGVRVRETQTLCAVRMRLAPRKPTSYCAAFRAPNESRPIFTTSCACDVAFCRATPGSSASSSSDLANKTFFQQKSFAVLSAHSRSYIWRVYTQSFLKRAGGKCKRSRCTWTFLSAHIVWRSVVHSRVLCVANKWTFLRFEVLECVKLLSNVFGCSIIIDLFWWVRYY